jgi:hypothetical protein
MAGQNEVRAKLIPSTAGKPRILQGNLTSAFYYSGSGTQYQHEFEFWNAKNGYVHATDPVEVYCGDFGQGTPSDTNSGLTKALPVATLQQAYYRLGGSVGGGSSAHDIGGKTVWLGEGEYAHESYSFGKLMLSAKVFVHVRKDPAITKANCIYRGDNYVTGATGPGLKMKYVAFHDITIKPTAGQHYAGTLNTIDYYNPDVGPTFLNDSQGMLWFDGCDFTSPYGSACFDVAHRGEAHPDNNTFNINSTACPTRDGLTSGWKTRICTFCNVNYYHSTPLGGLMVKHCDISFCAEDMQRNVQMSYEIDADNVNFNGTGFHPDIWQNYQASASIQNCICIGITALDSVSAQGFFCHGDTTLFRDIWLEDWRVINDMNGTDFAINGDTLSCMQWQQPLRHVVCKDVRIQASPAGYLLYRAGGADSDFTATNVYMIACYDVVENPTISDTAIFETYGGSALDVWPGTLPWTETVTGIVYRAS